MLVHKHDFSSLMTILCNIGCYGRMMPDNGRDVGMQRRTGVRCQIQRVYGVLKLQVFV